MTYFSKYIILNVSKISSKFLTCLFRIENRNNAVTP